MSHNEKLKSAFTAFLVKAIPFAVVGALCFLAGLAF
jgi:hypothetical protein